MNSPTYKFPASPGMPLFPVSPERMNASSHHHYYEMPDSPTHSPKHGRVSDVHGMVARFNSLDIKDHAELRKKDEAALRRAQVGREEAEGEMRWMKAGLERLEGELRESKEQQSKIVEKLEAELGESKEREKKLAKRLDVVMVSGVQVSAMSHC